MTNPKPTCAEALAAITLSMVSTAVLVERGIISRDAMREKIDVMLLAYERVLIDEPVLQKAHHILSDFLGNL